MPIIRWIFRNDQPSHGSVSHAYTDNVNLSLCRRYDRSKWDWTELKGERCAICQDVYKALEGTSGEPEDNE